MINPKKIGFRRAKWKASIQVLASEWMMTFNAKDFSDSP